MATKRDEGKDSGVTDQSKSSAAKNGSNSQAGADADQCEGVASDNASSASSKSQSKKSKKQAKSGSPSPSENATPESAISENVAADNATDKAPESPASTESSPASEASTLIESQASTENSAQEESSKASEAPGTSARGSTENQAENKTQDPFAEPADSKVAPDSAAHAHGAKIYGEVLERSIPVLEGRTYHHPMFIDALLAVGLLMAVGGITLGLVKFYITQEAKLDISQRRYSQAISVLQGAPVPGWFSMESDREDSPEELLNQAYYLDAMERLDANKNDAMAIKELEKIKPGSRFHKMANEILDLNAPKSAITLQGNVEHPATPSEANSPEAKPLIPENEGN